ncbi:MAG TPA: aminopeptidase P N-terminal domain-containing protein [Bacteroidales bacterium]
MNPVLPHRLFEQNRLKLCKRLKKNSVAVFHSNDEMPRNGDQFFPFRQNSDLFYLTGIDQEKTILILAPDHPVQKNREILFILKPDPQFETWHGKRLTKSEASETSGIQNICWIEELESLLAETLYFSEVIYLNQYENTKYISEIESRDTRFAQSIRQRFPLQHIEKVSGIMTDLRLVKEPEEINAIRHACSITGKSFERILKYVKPGVSEYEVEAEISHEFRINRAQGHAFFPIVASGENACFLHYIKNQDICRNGDLLLLDFGAEFDNYAADCSRTIPVNGRFTPRQKQLYNAVLNVFYKAKAMMVKGTSITLINKQVCKLFEEEHVKLGLYSMEDLHRQDTENPLYSRYFMHGISHFLGLDVHDSGNRFQTLQPGMVLTCEPGIYIREEGVGIRIENDILVTEEEPIDLMPHIPIEAEEIEEKMNTGR